MLRRGGGDPIVTKNTHTPSQIYYGTSLSIYVYKCFRSAALETAISTWLSDIVAQCCINAVHASPTLGQYWVMYGVLSYVYLITFRYKHI